MRQRRSYVAYNPLLSSLLAYWSLDEASGVREDLHSTNDLTDNNTVGYDTGKVSNAGSFVATNNEYLSVNAFHSLGSFTISLWFKTAAPANLMALAGKLTFGGATGQVEWGVYVWLAGFGLNLADGIVSKLGVRGGTILADTWYHGVATWQEGGAALGYVNNVKVIDTTYAGAAAVKTGNFMIGSVATPGSYWSGLIDEVGLWNRVLTATEVAQLYNSGNGLAYPFA